MKIIDINCYLEDLQKYIKSKIKTDDWKDIYQDTLIYLIEKQNVETTNLKGYILNAGRFFVYNYYNRKKSIVTYIPEYNHNKYIIDTENYKIDDKLYYIVNNISQNKTNFNILNMLSSGFTNKEISLTLELNENTIRTRINRIKKYAKKHYSN